jgi:uncharacterized protein involved in exopolysaccharide biosynthesis
MANRELSMDDYIAMLKRRTRVLLIPTVLAFVGGYLVSHAFPAKYTSQSTVLVQGQKVPDTYVAPVITADFTERVQSLQEQVLSPSRLRPALEGLNLESLHADKPGEEQKLIANIQQTMQVAPVITSMSAAAAQSAGVKKRKPGSTDEPVPGFTLSYTDSKADRAQRICAALTSMILDENLRSRSDTAKSTSDFLGRQVDEAKRALDDQDAKLAAFKKQYFGQLPSDVENNLRILASMNTQLDATTQTLSRAQQDKAYTESMLAQQTAAWKSSLSSTNPQTLEQELTQLQAQLMQLQARYTDDHPDVIKTKADIAEVKKKLDEVNNATAAPADANEKVSASEPPEIRQLRLQIHQYQSVIDQANVDQKRLQSQIGLYESRTAMSPTVEEQYKLLTRDNDEAQAFYQSLLAKKSAADLGSNMENDQQGEQMQIAVNAGLPEAPSFPNRPLFAAAGTAVGLAVGLLIAVVLEFSDKSIRTEKDAAAVTELPLLISLPWVGGEEENEVEPRRFWGRPDPGSQREHEHVGV